MPEAPDLEIIKEFLNERVAGQTIEYAKEVRPTVLRSLAGEFPEDIRGRTIDSFRRQGKFLMIELSGDRLLAVNPMLTGALQYCDAKERVRKATYVILGLANGRELRYIDDRQMGKIYYATLDQLSQIPRLLEQGPDVLDGITLEEFQARLKRFHGEIKGVLTRGASSLASETRTRTRSCSPPASHPSRSPGRCPRRSFIASTSRAERLYWRRWKCCGHGWERKST